MNKYHNEKTMFVKEVTIVVSNLNKSIDFYTNILGLSIIRKEEDKAYLGVDGKNVLLVLKEVKDAKPADNNIGLYHFALLLENRSDFAQLLKHLADVEYPLTGLSDHGISEAIYLQDPDNNGIEVAVDRYDEEQNVFKLDSFGPNRVDIYDLQKHLPTEKFTKLPKTTIMGHLHLHVNDIAAAKELFVEGLGFDIQFEYRGGAVFVSSGGYHHHLGFNIWNGRGATRRSPLQAGLESYVISVPNEYLPNIKLRLINLGYKVHERDDYLELFDVNHDKIILEVK
ncbi:MAG: glyoxalase [Acholeplasmataceae bacterium]|nr:glyoxalase [Acholeplasmataceae bacterium]